MLLQYCLKRERRDPQGLLAADSTVLSHPLLLGEGVDVSLQPRALVGGGGGAKAHPAQGYPQPEGVTE